MRIKFTLSLLTATAVLIAPAGASAIASTVTVSIKTPSGWSGRIFALPTQGAGVSKVVTGAGTVRLPVASDRVSGMSLQLFSSTGKYLGPVLLYRNSTGTSGSVRLRSTSLSTLNLGELVVLPGFGRLKTSLASSKVQLTPGSIRLVSGKPTGAGRLGLAAPPAGFRARAAALSLPGCDSSDPESGPGGDCDLDGVPNVVDVDDDGDRTLDMTDPQSARSSARVTPYSGIIQRYPGAQNVQTGANASTINAALGRSMEGLRFAFYLGQPYLVPGAPSATALDAVWAECPSGMGWCSGASSSVKANGFTEIGFGLDNANGGAGTKWYDFTGQNCTPGAGSPRYTCVARPASYPRFGFNLLNSEWGPTWTAFFTPNATDTLGTVIPGNTLSLKWRSTPTGTTGEMPVSIRPYFVTTPALVNAVGSSSYTVTDANSSTTPGSAGNPIVAASDGTVRFEFLRPQRRSIEGEPASSYYDIGGLNWGAIPSGALSTGGSFIPPNRNGGCPLTGFVGLDPVTATSDPITDLFRSVDRTVVDNPTSNTFKLGFTVNVRTCAASMGLPTTSGTRIAINIAAAGQPVTGGMDTSNLVVETLLP